MFSKKIGIDLGTGSVRVCSSSSTELLQEFNLITLDLPSQEFTKRGAESLEMLGKESTDSLVIKPVKNGVLQDIEAQKELLLPLINQLIGNHRIIKPEVYISIPKVLRDSDRNSISALVEELGCNKNCILIPEVILSAIGMKLPIQSSTGTAIVNMGAGKIETAVLASGGLHSFNSFQFGGDDLDQLIVDYFRTNNYLIGIKTAEKLKKDFLSAEVEDKNQYLDIKAKELSSGRAVVHKFRVDDLRVAVLPGLEKIASSIKSVFESLPPELSGDILDKGVVLTGGLSRLRKFTNYLTYYLNVPVYKIEGNDNSVIKGMKYLVDNPELVTKTIKI